MHDSFTVSTPSLFRRLSMAGFDALPSSHAMAGLLEVDVTELRSELRRLRRFGHKSTLFAAVVRAVALTLAEFPEFNAMRWGQRIVRFQGVDINVPVERRAGGEAVVGSLVIRDAERLSIEEIAEQIEAFKARVPTPEEEAVPGAPFLRVFLRLPRFLLAPALRAMSSSPKRVRSLFGTTMVSSIPMGGRTAAWALPPGFGDRAALFALGSIVPKPLAVDGEVRIREVLHLTVQLNHDLIDGTPSARFASRLVRNIENAIAN